MQNLVNQNSGKNFPYTIQNLTEEHQNKFLKAFPSPLGVCVQVGSENWFLPDGYVDYAETIYNFKARPDDVFICTFPRSGTTWTQEMIWLICNDLDYETASAKKLTERFPLLERHFQTRQATLTQLHNKAVIAGALDPMRPIYKELEAQTTRRFIKTHIPIQLMLQNALEVGAKIVYVARNPKDVAVSNYHYYKTARVQGFSGNFDTFLPLFMDDSIAYAPYWKHVLDGYKLRDHKNVHFMFYENCKMDLATSLKKLAKFLEKPLSDDDLPKLIEHLKFENCSKNPSINYATDPSNPLSKLLIRRGKVGGNPEMTEEMSQEIDKWTKKNLEGSDLKFPC